MPCRRITLPRLVAPLLALSIAIGGHWYPTEAQNRAFACSIEWTQVSGSQKRSVLAQFIKACRGTPEAARAQARLDQITPPPPPPPSFEQQCKSRWNRMGYTRDVQILRNFISDCGRYPIGQTARNWLAAMTQPIVKPPPPPQPMLTAQQLFDNAEAAEVRRDIIAARRDWLAACRMQMAVACNNLGVSYANLDHGKPDYSTALSYYDAGCSMKHLKSCNNARLTTSYADYRFVDLNKARDYFEKWIAIIIQGPAKADLDCRGVFNQSCLTLAQYYQNFDNSSNSKSRQFTLYAWSCVAGNTAICGNAGILAPAAGRMNEQRDYFTKACDGGDGASCLLLSYSLNNPAAGTVEPARALLRRKRACDLKYEPACAAIRNSSPPQ